MQVRQSSEIGLNAQSAERKVSETFGKELGSLHQRLSYVEGFALFLHLCASTNRA